MSPKIDVVKGATGRSEQVFVCCCECVYIRNVFTYSERANQIKFTAVPELFDADRQRSNLGAGFRETFWVQAYGPRRLEMLFEVVPYKTIPRFSIWTRIRTGKTIKRSIRFCTESEKREPGCQMVSGT